MDRVIVYDGALPDVADMLLTNKFSMIAEAHQNRAILGSNTVVAGLQCTPTSPTPDLHVTIGVGSIFQLDTIDAAAYGDLGVDTSANIVKMGILQAPQILTITPPSTSGFSQVYLVQTELQDVDSGSTVLSYYNSNNPDDPYSGPNNSGSSNFTTRLCKCTIGLKAGTAATTGTQTTPAPDVGFIGLFAVTVSNGATQITSGNIAQLPSAPFFPKLPDVPYDVQKGRYVYAGQDTGAANAYVITFAAGQPIPTSYVAGMEVKFKALNANTGASTINVQGLGVIAIRRGNGVALSANDIVSGGMVTLTFDGTLFQMSNYLGAGATSNTSTLVGIPYVTDTGTPNAVVATYSPAITAGQQIAGLTIEVKLANDITGACVINVSGLGNKPLTLGDGANPPYRAFVSGEVLLLIFDGTRYQIAGTSLSMFYIRPIANYTLYVNTATGSDTLYDGTSATIVGGTSSAGPLKTIGKAVAIAFNYAPSQFNITISVASGTYTESVITPSYAGPTLIIDGGSASGTLVNGTAFGACFVVNGQNTMTVRNFTVINTGAGSGFIANSAGATMFTNNTISSTCGTQAGASAVFVASSGGAMNPGNHVFGGPCNAFFSAVYNGTVSIGSFTYTIATPISILAAVAITNGLGSIATASNPGVFVNPGFVNGQKFSCVLNGIINAVGLGVNYFPGNTAGSIGSGGQYQA